MIRGNPGGGLSGLPTLKMLEIVFLFFVLFIISFLLRLLFLLILLYFYFYRFYLRIIQLLSPTPTKTTVAWPINRGHSAIQLFRDCLSQADVDRFFFICALILSDGSGE